MSDTTKHASCAEPDDGLHRFQSDHQVAVTYQTPHSSPRPVDDQTIDDDHFAVTSLLATPPGDVQHSLCPLEPHSLTTLIPVSPPRTPTHKMSGHYYYHPGDQEDQEQEREHRYTVPYASYTTDPQRAVPLYTYVPQQQQTYQVDPQHVMPPQYQHASAVVSSAPTWTPMAYTPQQAGTANAYAYPEYLAQDTSSSFPQYTESMASPYPAGTLTASAYLTPPSVAGPSRSRASRAASIVSRTSSVSYNTDNSRSTSPNAMEMAKWGYRLPDGRWKCSYPQCTSLSTFSRGCDLRKHHKRHTKTLFCRYRGCAQSTSGGFSSKKDRARHEASHNPEVLCDWPGCERKFSRVDNMKDHVKRVHLKHATG